MFSISEPVATALGWTIFHSLWQGGLIGLALYITLQLSVKKSARFRYRLSGIALAALFGTALCTLGYYHPSATPPTGEGFLSAGEVSYFIFENVNLAPLPQKSQFWILLSQNIHSLALVWLIGVAFFSLKLLVNWGQIQYLKSVGIQPLGAIWQQKTNEIASKIFLHRTVQIAQSTLIQSPLTLGHFKPIILLPVGIINTLPMEQVEAILAHELAHIARYDYLINFLQSVVEVLFFYHPVVWWISEHIRTEREHCCDDIAIAYCGDSLVYAKALASIPAVVPASSALAMAFGRSKTQLLYRIQRILNQTPHKSTIMEKTIITGVLLIGMLVGFMQQNRAADKFLPVLTKDIPELPVPALVDTIPNMTGTAKLTIDDDDKKVETTVEDGVIQSLKIDGKNIPESEFENYEPMVQELFKNVPPPPAPPSPPAFPTPPTPPTPPAAPDAPAPPASPAAPGAPMPPAPPASREMTLEIEQEIAEQKRMLEIEIQQIKEHHKANLEKIKQEIKQEILRMEDMNEEERKRYKEQLEKEMERMEIIENRKMEQLKREIERTHRAEEREQREMERMEREIERKKRAIEREITRKHRENFMKNLSNQLLQDGLIQNAERYSFDLSYDQLKVNGKKQSDKTRKKYQRLFEKKEGNGYQFGKNDRVKIKMKPNSQSVSISLESEDHSYNNEGPIPENMLKNMDLLT